MNPERFSLPPEKTPGKVPQPMRDDGAHLSMSGKLEGNLVGKKIETKARFKAPRWRPLVVHETPSTKQEIANRRQTLEAFMSEPHSPLLALKRTKPEKLVMDLQVVEKKRATYVDPKKSWDDLSPIDKVRLRQEEMRSLAIQAELAKAQYFKPAAQLREVDRRYLLNFDDRVADYCASDDIPDDFKDDLRQTFIALKSDPRFEALPIQSVTVIKYTEDTPPPPIRRVVQEAAPAIKNEEAVISAALAGSSPEDSDNGAWIRPLLEDLQREREERQKMKPQYLDSEMMMGGNLNSQNPQAEWFKNKAITIVKEEATNTLSKQEAYAAGRLMENLPDQLDYEHKSGWGKFWTRAKTFGMWRTITGRGSDTHLRQVRYESASILRERATSSDKIDQGALTQIADALDGVNTAELEAERGWRPSPSEVAQLDEGIRQEQIAKRPPESVSQPEDNQRPKQAA